MITDRRAARAPLLAAVGLAAGLLVAGCGTEVGAPGADTPRAATESTDLPTPDELTCPSGEMVGTAGGYLSRWPQGADDPDELVAEQSTDDGPWVRVGRRAYVLRPDGTAFEVHDLVKGPKGWFLHGYEACVE